MKVNPHQTTPPSAAKLSPAKSASKPAPPKQEKTNKTASKSSSDARHRINHWFATLGIESNEPNDKVSIDEVLYEQKRKAAHRRYKNLQSIKNMATQVVVSGNAHEHIDADWFYAYAKLAENINSPPMQKLWGAILSVEISKPGSFSLRTLETLRQLTHKDAQIFKQACALACRRVGDKTPRILIQYHQRNTLFRWFTKNHASPINLAKHGLSYPNIMTLVDMGLLHVGEVESGEFVKDESVQFRYGERTFTLHAKRSGLAISYYKFSSTGAELFGLSSPAFNENYFKDLSATLVPAFSLDSSS